MGLERRIFVSKEASKTAALGLALVDRWIYARQHAVALGAAQLSNTAFAEFNQPDGWFVAFDLYAGRRRQPLACPFFCCPRTPAGMGRQNGIPDSSTQSVEIGTISSCATRTYAISSTQSGTQNLIGECFLGHICSMIRQLRCVNCGQDRATGGGPRTAAKAAVEAMV